MIVRGHENVLVVGITGRQATFWTEHMMAYGTRVVAGTSPRKAGTEHLGVPVYASAAEAAGEHRIDATVFFVPPAGVRDAVIDAVEAGIGKLVVLTEHVPVHDVMYMLAVARDAGAQVIGPNTAGIVTPGECFLGFMPAFNETVFRPGRTAVISRSGSLGTLACSNLVDSGLGVSCFIGIGGDPVLGTETRDALVVAEADERSDSVAIVGEIGGRMEEDAGAAVSGMTKPVVAFIAGAASPPGTRMGHAGAIVTGKTGGHRGKCEALRAGGATVVDLPTHIGPAVAERLAVPTGEPR